MTDAVAGVVSIATMAGLGGEDFNVGTGRGQRLRDLAELLWEHFPTWKRKAAGGEDYLGMGDKATYCVVDISKARRAFGLRSRFNLTRAAEDYFEILDDSNNGSKSRAPEF